MKETKKKQSTKPKSQNSNLIDDYGWKTTIQRKYLLRHFLVVKIDLQKSIGYIFFSLYFKYF